MKRISLMTKLWRPIVGIAGLALIILWSSGGCTAKVKPEKLSYDAGIPIPENAEQITVKIETVSPHIDIVGTTESEERINLSARIPAYVNAVYVSAGDKVKKGQLLVSLDDREIKEQLAAAEAQFKQAKTEYDRTRQLFEKNATTDQALTAAESMFNSASAQTEQIKVMLTYTQITSPIDGVVTDRRIEAGDLANPGQVLLAVYDPTRMRLLAPVPVRLVDKLALGQEVNLTLDKPAGNYQGKVSEIVSEIDPASRTQNVKIHILDNEGDILPGTFGRVWVSEDARDMIRVPASAVYRVGQLELVQVVVNDRAVRRLVKTGARFNGQIEILSGLQNGDVVLVNPIKEG